MAGGSRNIGTFRHSLSERSDRGRRKLATFPSNRRILPADTVSPRAARMIASFPRDAAMDPVHGAEPEHTAHRVLVVDDNADAADSLAMLMSALGNDVRVAYDGEEAVETALAFSPEVVLLDIGLPKMHGYDVARRIRAEKGNDVLLVAVTGWAQEDDRRRTREAGFDFHFSKPIDPEDLVRVVGAAPHSKPH